MNGHELRRAVVEAYLHGCEPIDITLLRAPSGQRLTVDQVCLILWRAGVTRRPAGVLESVKREAAA